MTTTTFTPKKVITASDCGPAISAGARDTAGPPQRGPDTTVGGHIQEPNRG
jgi:hypothetical protein